VTEIRNLLTHAAARAADHREGASQRPVFPIHADLGALNSALGSLQDEPLPALTVIDELADAVEPALVASAGPRYFGFVIGGALDAASAADVLTTG
jgi:hypothetical protein